MLRKEEDAKSQAEDHSKGLVKVYLFNATVADKHGADPSKYLKEMGRR